MTMVRIALPCILSGIVLANTAYCKESTGRDRPNVILIITDDQGYGDLGVHGNPKIKTPCLDRFAQQSVQFKHFYVSPVCAPTRASLMTGRYNYRTGVTDTYQGRAMMAPDEVTLAEMLSAAGYRTGIFGKWHLGDNYPMRPIDQGFGEALVHNGGGIGQPSDPPGGSSYFNPILRHNGKEVKTKGYCSDIYTDAAIRFVSDHRTEPFFVYLAFNCPHVPLEVPDSYYLPYKQMDLTPGGFPTTGHPLKDKVDLDVTARVYGMITNIDDNLGRLFDELDRLKLADNTIVIFLTDNGPQQARYNAGMLARKGSVHEGGIRVPCFVRWPRKLQAGRMIDRIAAHIDITPTLLEACGAPKPAEVKFDGRSLMPLLSGGSGDWPDRTLFFQWHRGDAPVLYRAFAARSQRYKLVQPAGGGDAKMPADPAFKLHDMESDPLEMKDIASAHADIAQRMKAEYESWFRDVSDTRGYDPPRIHLGTPNENPARLTRQDWRSASPRTPGHWEVLLPTAGAFDITLRFEPKDVSRTARFVLGEVRVQQTVEPKRDQCVFRGLRLPAGPYRLEARLALDDAVAGVQYVEVLRVE